MRLSSKLYKNNILQSFTRTYFELETTESHCTALAHLFYKSIPRHVDGCIDFLHSLSNQIPFDYGLEVFRPDRRESNASVNPHAWMKAAKELNLCFIVDHDQIWSIKYNSWSRILHDQVGDAAQL
jgi:hypothetical protein